MRGIRLFLTAVVALAVLGGALFALRLPIAGWAAERALAAQGFAAPSLRVTKLGRREARVEDVAAGAGDLRLDYVEASFDPLELFRERRVRRIDIGPGRIAAAVDEDGAVSLAGARFAGGGEGEAGALPFDALAVAPLELSIRTPFGNADGAAEGRYDIAGDGAFMLALNAERAGAAGWIVRQAALEGSVDLAGDGAAAFDLRATGDLESPFGALRNGDVSLQGAGGSWRDLAGGAWRAVAGEATIRIEDGRIALDEVAAGEAINAQSGLAGGPFETVRLGGAATVRFSDGALEVAIADAPLSAEADGAARLVIEAMDDAPVFELKDGRRAVLAYVGYRGGAVAADARIDLRETATGWAYDAPVRLMGFDTPKLRLDDMSAVVRGTMAGPVFDYDATLQGRVDAARIGRFAIDDAPLRARAAMRLDVRDKTLVVDLPAEGCAVLERARLAVAEQNMAASLRDATLCAGDGPAARIDFSETPTTEFAGVLTAAHASYRLGETRFVGRPPDIALAGAYHPLQRLTEATGAATGGAVVINDLLRFDRLDATLSLRLDADGLVARADGKDVRITEYADDPRLAPLFASGSVELVGDEAAFAYKIRTPGGEALGAGEGVHDVAAASGRADFDFGRLVFKPDGLQPDRLAPVLKGIIGETVGAATGTARFTWSDAGIGSSADFRFEDVAFRGPGLTVTQTVGVNGDVALKSLWPVATDGDQRITIDGVDLGALQLESGEVVFAMPGDDTLEVSRAIFPWFGGEIGVRDAAASFSGGTARAPLNVSSVDLEQILDFVDVEGLSGTGTLDGVLPLVVENGRASFVDGELRAEGPGRISYVGKAADAASAAGEDARIAFDLLRDLRYERLTVSIDGPLDGRIDFRLNFEGTGAVSVSNAKGRVPVKYAINLDAALMELLNQANLSRDLRLQIESAVAEDAQ